MTSFPKPLPHGRIEPLFPDVFVVRGTFRIAPLVSIPRNMIVLRQRRSLTLVNAVRLDAAGERALLELGDIEHVVKLGFFHTRDDAYYRSRFSPRYWAPAPTDPSAEKLVDGAVGPVDHSSVFSFARARDGEAALLLEQAEGNLLITCDSVQNWVDTRGSSLLGGLTLRAMGFLTPAKIGPLWLKRMTADKPIEMKPDFDRLLAREFSHLIAGHGVLLRDDAKAALARSCQRTFS